MNEDVDATNDLQGAIDRRRQAGEKALDTSDVVRDEIQRLTSDVVVGSGFRLQELTSQNRA